MQGQTQDAHTVDATPDDPDMSDCALVRFVAAGEVAVHAPEPGDAGEQFAKFLADLDEEKALELVEGAHFEISDTAPASEATFN